MVEIRIDVARPEVEWSEDGGTASLSLDVRKISFDSIGDTDTVRIVHDIPRRDMLFLWSRTDERLYREAQAAAQHGTPSDMLDEVAAAREAVLRERDEHR